jgi:hypothetical protein
MKKYEYEILYLAQDNFPTIKINDMGREGWRVLNISWSNGGNILSVFFEREIIF